MVLAIMDTRGISETFFVRPSDSSTVGKNELETIVWRIAEIVQRKEEIKNNLLISGIKREVGGIVIAHETEILHITSLVVAFEFSVQKLTRPVVFAASHSTIDAKNRCSRQPFKVDILCKRKSFQNRIVISGCLCIDWTGHSLCE